MQRKRTLAAVGAVALLAAGAWLLLRHRGAGENAKDERATSGARGAARIGRNGIPGAPRWLGQVGLQPRRVAGRVTYHGAPATGATVRLELAGALRSARAAIEVKAGRDGAFDFGPQPPVQLLVVAAAPDRAPAGALVDLRDPALAPPSDRLELVLADCTHTVYGVVHDHGSGIAGAAVRVATGEESVALATTGNGGDYQLCFGPGAGFMMVEADGYARARLDIGTGKRMRRDVELSPEAPITGVVLRPDDRPAAGAFVFARPTEMTPFALGTSSGVTDEAGRFSLGGLSPGRYSLSARDAGLRTPDEVDAVAAVGGGEDVTLRLLAMVTVRGRVLEDGRPVAGARIGQRAGRFMRLDRSSVDSANAVSQADGTFVLDAVPPGTFSIAVDGYEVLEPATAEAVAPETQITVKVAHKARVLGRVTRDGAPVAGAQVRMIGTDRSWGGSATTAADGHYQIDGLDAGEFEVNAQSENAFARKRTIKVEKGQRLEGVDIELDLAGEVSGVVVDQDGAPVAGVAVTFEMGPRVDWGFATTEEDGTFVAGAMSGGGTYKVTVKPSRWSSTQLKPARGTTFPEVPLTDGHSHATGIRIAVQLDRKQISGTVVGADKQPAADVKVAAFPPLESSFMMRFTQPSAEAMTGADGTFVLRDLMNGEYGVRAVAGNGVEVTAEKIPAGRSNLRLQLPASGGIDGELVGFGKGVRVAAEPMAPFERFAGRVRGDHFTVESIPPGSYMVSAREGARSADALVEVTAGKRATVTLTSKGTATVTGRAVNLVTREPLAGLDCSDSGGWVSGEHAAVTGSDGRFKLEVPAGQEVSVHCMSPTARFRSMGTTRVELAPGTTKEIVVEVIVMHRTSGMPGELGLNIQPGPPAKVYKVTPGGPAERAGVEVGDAILKVDGVTVDTLASTPVLRLMLDHAIGEKVELVLRRNGREVNAAVEVVARKRGDE